MNPRIVVLEEIEATSQQRERLEGMGVVEWFDSSTLEESKIRVKNADVVAVDWIDPNQFLSYMKASSLLALMSTGYGWIDTKRARQLGISISNVPGYATEAVAEHIIGLALAVVRKTMIGDRNIRLGKEEKGYLRGLELRNRVMGIIGLGRIGHRVGEIASCLGMNVITYNRTPKNLEIARDVALKELLESSDIVCITCPLNDDSKNMLNLEGLKLLRQDAIVVGTTWGVVEVDALVSALRDNLILGAGFDVAIEGGKIELPEGLTKSDNIVLTPHIGFNTLEAKRRQVDICVSNIESYLRSEPKNIVN